MPAAGDYFGLQGLLDLLGEPARALRRGLLELPLDFHDILSHPARIRASNELHHQVREQRRRLVQASDRHVVRTSGPGQFRCGIVMVEQITGRLVRRLLLLRVHRNHIHPC
ncbi:MAG: hypothetical protein MZW92_78730 [Comamonadaceae bacterium]|nr:hypothetical protein [Comamonadaceae bacterium]